MNKMIRMLTKLVGNEKNKAGKFPKGKKATEILKKNLDIVFDENEAEILYEFSFKGPTVDQSGSGLMCKVHDDGEDAFYAFSLSGVQFTAVQMPDGFEAVLSEEEEEPTKEIQLTPLEKLLSDTDKEQDLMAPPEEIPSI